MSWQLFAFMAAILTGTAALLEKRTLRREHAASFAAALSLVSFVVSLSFVPVAEFKDLTLPALSTIIIAGILAAASFLLITKALRHMEVSTMSPLMVIEPGIVAILAFYLLGEALTLFQVLGICLLIIGMYFLEHAALPEFKGTVKSFFTSQYVIFALVAILFYSFGSIFDRVVLARFDVSPATLIVVAHAVAAISFVIFLSLKYKGWRDIMIVFKDEGMLIILIALVSVLYRFFQLQAVALASVGLVIAVKRTSALFATIIGGELWSEHNLYRKIIACIIMVTGAALVVV